ncbi:hypothetical protein FB45DRAFT_1034534 [Roridomyces roridus]|uniref:NADH:flavin oxidoreductase/NADH oxidase N-terminal domain-containing protein n=1 Tax=Roridomyces roridus TaxID=1738132 RepID=A0AAD7BCR3_9AGAR|nr:hypothetical protein FB45DRAFT_1034534 [Roridomyces roridus]
MPEDPTCACNWLPLVSASNIPNATGDVPSPHVRTDSYGGPSENRVRFPLEVVQAVVNAVGKTKTGFRISPWGTWNGEAAHRLPICYPLITLSRYALWRPQADVHTPRHCAPRSLPHLAYLHVVEPRVDGVTTVESVKDGYSNDFIREFWGSRPLISAGGYTRETALPAAEEKGDLVAFARPYIANPDLPYHLSHGIALAVGNRALYYAPGSSDPAGYTDYPFASVVEAH